MILGGGGHFKRERVEIIEQRLKPQSLRRICEEKYIQNCATIVSPVPFIIRHDIMWTDEQINKVNSMMKKFPFYDRFVMMIETKLHNKDGSHFCVACCDYEHAFTWRQRLGVEGWKSGLWTPPSPPHIRVERRREKEILFSTAWFQFRYWGKKRERERE